MGGTEEVLAYLFDEENAWWYLKDRASDDVPCMCYDWFAARDPTMLQLYMMVAAWWRCLGRFHSFLEPTFLRSIFTIRSHEWNSFKRCIHFGQLYERAQESDYRVCMDTLMELS